MILCRARVGMPPRSPGIGVLLVHQVPESPQAPRIELAGCSTRRHRGRGRRPIRSGCCPRIVVTACGYLGDDGRSAGGRSTIRRPRFGRPWSGRSVFWLTRFGRLRFGRSRFGRGCRWIRAHGVRSGCGWVAVGGGRSVVVGRWWSVVGIEGRSQLGPGPPGVRCRGSQGIGDRVRIARRRDRRRPGRRMVTLHVQRGRASGHSRGRLASTRGITRLFIKVPVSSGLAGRSSNFRRRSDDGERSASEPRSGFRARRRGSWRRGDRTGARSAHAARAGGTPASS